MSGSQYIALSGLRARIDELDRLAGDIANVGTAGYKGERDTTASALRPSFDQTLQSAIDTTFGGRKLDLTDGALATTGRALDVALDGPGFFAIETPAGPRYTRNGHFTLNADRQLVTESGEAVRGTGGSPIVLGDGDIRIDGDGTVWTGTTKAGRISVVTFPDPGALQRDTGSGLRADGQTPIDVAAPNMKAGTLEQSNVSVADRLAQLTSVSRGFEALQKSISMLMNDVDGRAIDSLGRRS
jgi:flagellar basal-body rod protein FlgF